MPKYENPTPIKKENENKNKKENENENENEKEVTIEDLTREANKMLEKFTINLNSLREAVEGTEPKAITEEDKKDLEILSGVMKASYENWGKKVYKILKKVESNSGSDSKAVQQLKKLLKDWPKTAEQRESLREGLENIGKSIEEGDDLGLSKLINAGKEFNKKIAQAAEKNNKKTDK